MVSSWSVQHSFLRDKTAGKMFCELSVNKIENFGSLQISREIIWDWWQAFDFPLILCENILWPANSNEYSFLPWNGEPALSSKLSRRER